MPSTPRYRWNSRIVSGITLSTGWLSTMMAGWYSASRTAQRSRKRSDAEKQNSPWRGSAGPHHGHSLCETVAVFWNDRIRASGRYRQGRSIKEKSVPFSPSDGASNAPANLQKRPIYKAFREKMKRTGNRHIVSITGPIVVRMFLTNLNFTLRIRRMAHIFPRTFADLLSLWYDHITIFLGC